MGFLAEIPTAIASGFQAVSTAASSAVRGLTATSTLASATNTGSVSSLLGKSALQTGLSILGSKAAGAAVAPPKLPPPPSAPNIGSVFNRMPSLIGPNEGDFNGTFVSGSNRSANISGGKSTGSKTLLGQ